MEPGVPTDSSTYQGVCGWVGEQDKNRLPGDIEVAMACRPGHEVVVSEHPFGVQH